MGYSGNRVFVAFVTMALIVAGIIVGGWKLHWWLAQSNQDHQYKVNTHGPQYQAGLVSQERDRVVGYDQLTTAIASSKDAGVKTADTAQRDDIKTSFCQVYTDLTQAPTDIALAHGRICN
jgi:hypothetical protein